MDAVLPNPVFHTLVVEGVTGVVNMEITEGRHDPDELVVTVLITGKFVVGGRHSSECKHATLNRLINRDGSQPIGIDLQSIGRKRLVGRGDDDLQFGVGLHQRVATFPRPGDRCDCGWR